MSTNFGSNQVGTTSQSPAHVLEGAAPGQSQEGVAKKLIFSGTTFTRESSRGEKGEGRDVPLSDDHRPPTDEDPEGHLQPAVVVVTNLENDITKTSTTQVGSEVNTSDSLAAARKMFSFTLPDGQLDPIPLSSSEEETLSQTLMLSSPQEEPESPKPTEFTLAEELEKEPGSPKPTEFTLAEELEKQLELLAEEPLARELESDLQQAEEQHVALGNITPPHKRRTGSVVVSPSQ